MNKKEIIKQLESFPYNRDDYWLITGAAMVLYGIKKETNDIDLGCNKEMADQLQKDGYLYQHSENGNRCFRYGDQIEVFENWLKDSVTSIDGFPVISIRGLIEMKRELGRDKDLKDIKLINEYLRKEAEND